MRLYHLIMGSQWTDTCNEYVCTPQVHNYVLIHNQRDMRKILSGDGWFGRVGRVGLLVWWRQDILKSPHPKFAY